uniref:Uncharacterized protein MANES_09G001500 n=1 Tax=Rhizophora mucronata TaxID=61149 RepID=A0A2P2LKI5_RHIMU
MYSNVVRPFLINITWKKNSSPKGTQARIETAVHTIAIAAKGAREKPFPRVSTISVSILFLLTKHRTVTAIPTPASSTSQTRLIAMSERKVT